MPEYVAPLDTDWALSDAWSVASGVLEMDGNYMQLHDNVLDLTHFGFIHIGSVGITDWIKPPKASTTTTSAKFRSEFVDRPLQPAHCAITGTELDRPADLFVTEGEFVSPAVHAAIETIEYDAPTPAGRSKYTLRIVHATTPISMDKYRYHYLFGWDVKLPSEAIAAMQAGIETVFTVDKVILHAISETLKWDSRGIGYSKIKLQADTPQLHARRKLKALIDRE